MIITIDFQCIFFGLVITERSTWVGCDAAGWRRFLLYSVCVLEWGCISGCMSRCMSGLFFNIFYTTSTCWQQPDFFQIYNVARPHDNPTKVKISTRLSKNGLECHYSIGSPQSGIQWGRPVCQKIVRKEIVGHGSRSSSPAPSFAGPGPWKRPLHEGQVASQAELMFVLLPHTASRPPKNMKM